MLGKVAKGILPVVAALMLLGTVTPALASGPEAECPKNDARSVPLAERYVAGLLSLSGTPGWYETSQFMIGKVAVGVVLPESTGSQENWTPAEEAKVLSEVTAATQWWAAREPRANLEFQIEMHTQIPVSVEPIALSSSYSNESQWVGQAMSHLGFPGTSLFQQVYAFNNDLRTRLGTDWAFTIFVVDSSNDSDNRFADGYFAYSYLGGPHMVMTYENGNYGPDRMDAVGAHEMGHVFRALDQYAGAGQPCEEVSGYLGIPNQNSDYGSCQIRQSSIMKECVNSYIAGSVDPFARGQLGWRDSDCDSLLDPVDTQPYVSMDWNPEQVGNAYRYHGSARDIPFSGAQMNAVTINAISEVRLSLSDSLTIEAIAEDGFLDSPQEDFYFDLPAPASGLVTVQATNSAGNQGYALLLDAPYQEYIPLVLR